MTVRTPLPGHGPAVPDTTPPFAPKALRPLMTPRGPQHLSELATVEARLAAWSEWFGCEPPPRLSRARKGDDGSIRLRPDLLAWHVATGASLDWTLRGDVRTLAAAYRKRWLEDREFVEMLNRLDETELHLVLEALKALAAGAPTDETMAECRRRIESLNSERS